MVKWWRLIKDQFCDLMDTTCQCPDIAGARGKTADCDDCDYYLYWVSLGRPKRPFQPNEWEMDDWKKASSSTSNDAKTKSVKGDR